VAQPTKLPQPHGTAQARRQLRKDLLISLLALVSVGIGLYDVSRHGQRHFNWLDLLDLAIVAVFIVDFVISARANGDWGDYLRRHWFELPALIPITGGLVAKASAVSLVRGVRLVRLLRVARVLRLLGTAARPRRFWSRLWRISRRAHLLGLMGIAAAIIVVGATLAWMFESRTNRAFADGGNVAWWALNMFSNVAYVNFQPATVGGRIVAAVLEFSGIGFIGLFTASLAGAIITDKSDKRPRKQAPTD
jgi:voltage-gated potassium channel